MSRIDVHQHLLPGAYTRWLRSKAIHAAGGRELPQWSAQRAIALMGTYAIETAVLSLSTPGTWLGDAAEAAAMAEQVNELGAELVKDHSGRFGYFATILLPDLDAALQAATYALDELAADGVMLLANTDGVYLGHPDHDPLLAELDRRSAVVFVTPPNFPHRRSLACRPSPRTSSSTPPAPQPTWCCTESPAATPTSRSSCPTRAVSSPTSPIASLPP